MRIKPAPTAGVEIDMTPMIDIVFQLLAFFTFILNFEAAEQDERVMLPSSVLARPPASPLASPITLQITRRGTVLAGGQEYATADSIRPVLNNEKYVLKLNNKSPADATIVIRAHRDSQAGQVQELIRVCQELEFYKFTLRAKEEP